MRNRRICYTLAALRSMRLLLLEQPTYVTRQWIASFLGSPPRVTQGPVIGAGMGVAGLEPRR